MGDLLARARTSKHFALDHDVSRFEARTGPEHARVDEFAQRFGARTGPVRVSLRRSAPTSRCRGLNLRLSIFAGLSTLAASKEIRAKG